MFREKARDKRLYNMLLFVRGKLSHYICYNYTQTRVGGICICMEFVWKYIQKKRERLPLTKGHRGLRDRNAGEIFILCPLFP